VAAQGRRHLMARVPYTLHPVLPDHGRQVTHRTQETSAFPHLWARIGEEHASAPRLTNTNPPWTKGPVERMHRTLKDATVTQDAYQTPPHLKEHLHAFLLAYHGAKRLATLSGLTPDEEIWQRWQNVPARLTIHPYHHTRGLNSSARLLPF
jgi:hypothetical protein